MLTLASVGAAIASVAALVADKPARAALFGIAAVAFAAAHHLRRAR